MFKLVKSAEDFIGQIAAPFYESLPKAVIITDLNGNIVSVNNETVKNTGYSRSELIGKNPDILNAEAGAQEIQKKIIDSLNSNKLWSGELLQARKDGSTYLASFDIFPIVDDEGETIAWASVQCDITERKMAETVLRDQLIFLQTLIDTIPNPIYYIGKDGLYKGCNTAFENYLGISADGLIGKSVYDIYPKELADLYQKKDEELFNNPGIQSYEGPCPNSSGKTRQIIHSKATYTDINGEVAGFVGVIIDNTELLKAKQKIKRNQELINKIMDSIPLFVAIQDMNYKIGYANGYFRKQFGDPNDRYCYEIFEDRREPCEQCYASTALNAGRSSHRTWKYRENKIYDVYDFPFTDFEGTPFVLTVGIDITERNLLAEKLARLERLNIVGEMAASISHEIRNPMTTVRGFLQLLQGKNTEHLDYYELMIQELDRANEIISEYLSLARDRRVKKEPKDLNSIINKVLPLIKANGLKNDIQIVLDLNEIPELLLDENEIRQMLFNLVQNGMEAMGPGGVLTIATSADERDVILSVKDTGPGIESDLTGKIGMPFYTTKTKGTGLGLAVCNSIALKHNAMLNFESSSAGTTFFIRFQL